MNKRYAKYLAAIALSATAVTSQAAQRSDVYENGAPTYNGIEIPLAQSNNITEMIGDSRINTDFYIGEYYITTDNRTDSESKEEGNALATVIGASINFSQPELFTFSLTPKYTNVDWKSDDADQNNWEWNSALDVDVCEAMSVGFTYGQTSNSEQSKSDDNDNNHTDDMGVSLTLKPTESFHIRLEANQGNEINDLEDDKIDDKDWNTFSVNPYLILNDTDKIGLKFIHGQNDYDVATRKDSKWNELDVQFEKQLTDTISANGYIGYLNRQYDDKQGNQEQNDNFSGIVGGLDFTLALSEKMSLSVGGSHTAADDSTGSNYAVTDSGSISLSYSPIVELTTTASLNTSSTQNIEAQGDEKSHGCSLAATYNINRNIAVGASYSFDRVNAKLANDSGDTSTNTVTFGVSAAF